MHIFYLLTDFQNFCCTFYDKLGTKYCKENILPHSEQTINYPQKFILEHHMTLIFSFNFQTETVLKQKNFHIPITFRKHPKTLDTRKQIAVTILKFEQSCFLP